MKRVLAIVLSLLLVFSMIACGNQSDTAQNAGTQGSSNAAGSLILGMSQYSPCLVPANFGQA